MLAETYLLDGKTQDGWRVVAAMRAIGGDEDWYSLGQIGQYITQANPDFDPRTYGFRKLSDLVKSRPDLFETEERRTRSGQPILYLRPK